MRINISFLKSCSVLFALFMLVALTGCSDDDKIIGGNSGYVQFKLYRLTDKKATTRATELDYLASAKKIEVVLQNSAGSRIRQTLNLNAYNDDNAEYGLRSDKLELLAGKYSIIGYYLYDELNQELLAGIMDDEETFNVIEGGMEVKDLYVAVKKRGRVNFSLIKDFSEFTENVGRANSYQFSNIRKGDIEIKNLFSEQTRVVKDIKFRATKKVIDNNGTAWVTTYAASDSIVSLEAGGYEIVKYSLYDNNGRLLELGNPITATKFTISDNEQTDVDVPIAMNEASENIKDYYALKEIWEALDGKNWYWIGDTYSRGVNWNFDKDIDTWGNQPGVTLNTQGRVTNLSIGGFGPKGDIPAALGQLTELTYLDLGNHNDKLGGNYFPTEMGETTDRMNYYNVYLKKDIRASFSETLHMGFEKMGKKLGSAVPYAKTLPQTRDFKPGAVTNGITSIPKEIGNLKKLTKLYIANGYIKELPEEMALLENCTDLEIYNCPLMTEYPMAINKMPELEALNISTNPQMSADEIYNGLNDFALNSPSREKIQLLYAGYNSLEEVPASFSNLKKIDLIEFTACKIKKIHPLTRAVAPVKVLFDDNEIEEIPVDADGNYCNIDDIETFSFSGNKLKVLPNIFTAKTVFQISDIDFSFNEIESIEGEADGTYKGVNTETLSLAGNKLKKFPSVIFNVGSSMRFINVAGNGIETFEDGSLWGKYLSSLVTLDLSFNKLSKLPKEFDATKLPYLYSIELSYNRFRDFPYAPLNCSGLTIMSVRYQRDEKGVRTLSTWPTGLYTCPSLLAFYVGGNDLRKIDDKISPQIYLFEIQDNPNISIDVSDVCYYIEAGIYNLVYDASQDIRGCSSLNLDN